MYAVTTWSGSSFTSDGKVVRAGDLDPNHLEESEFQQGLNILEAVERTPSLSHVVWQSMHQAGRSPPSAEHSHAVPAPLHHRAKWRQEAALRARAPKLGCAWSVLRQPTYLENFANDVTAAQGTQLRLLKPGVVSGLLDPDDELTVISVEDLGAMAVAMLRGGPGRYGEHTISAGAERVSGRRLAEAASRAHGTAHFRYRQVPWWVLEYFIPVDYPKQLKRWLAEGGNDEGARADADRTVFAESRALYPELRSVEEFLLDKGVRELPTPLWQKIEPEMPRARATLGRRAALGGMLAACAPAFAATSWKGFSSGRPGSLSLPTSLVASHDKVGRG